MSKLFAKFLMNENKISADDLAKIFYERQIVARYFKLNKVYQFRVLDFYEYVRTGNVWFISVKIEEADLLRMISIDNFNEDEKNELYYHKLLSSSGNSEGLEQKELDDDVFWGISLLQYFFHISRHTLILIRRQFHLYKLYKEESPYFELKERILHSNGGRPVGTAGMMTEADKQNFENLDRIIKTCVEKDRYIEFMDLHKSLIRCRQTKLSLTGAKWKFRILRYQWRLENSFSVRDLDYEKQLIQKNKEYKIFDTLEF